VSALGPLLSATGGYAYGLLFYSSVCFTSSNRYCIREWPRGDAHLPTDLTTVDTGARRGASLVIHVVIGDYPACERPLRASRNGQGGSLGRNLLKVLTYQIYLT
jgi:hypothetical protein